MSPLVIGLLVGGGVAVLAVIYFGVRFGLCPFGQEGRWGIGVGLSIALAATLFTAAAIKHESEQPEPPPAPTVPAFTPASPLDIQDVRTALCSREVARQRIKRVDAERAESVIAAVEWLKVCGG